MQNRGEKMEVIGVRYQKNDLIRYFSPKGRKFLVDDYVLVPSAQGKRMAKVVLENQQIDPKKLPQKVKEIIAKPAPYEIKKAHQLEEEAVAALKQAKECARRHQLDIKLLSAEILLNRSKLILKFVAEERVDFRRLIKDLSSHFKMRIELRQIGVRDEAKALGGLASCGRMLCCSTFLGNFTAVSIKMAKEQDLSLNPAKISGFCGRLMCCLKYEDEIYREARKKMPKWGTKVLTPDGEGIVKGTNYLNRTLKIQLEEKKHFEEYHADEIRVVKK